ncbi:MAG TPA: glycoside hydrolase [Lachnospiraceae bacterium]|nr:glycoside hydrolase [Lachnospiraceae bacterium]
MKKVLGCFGYVFLLLILTGAAVFGVYAYRKYMPTKELADRDSLYAAEQSDGILIYLNYERQEAEGRLIDGRVYLPLSWVNDNLNERFYHDSREKLLLYALPDRIEKSGADALDETGGLLFVEDGENTWLSLAYTAQHTDIRMKSFLEDGYPRVYIENTKDSYTAATVSRDTPVRVRGGVKSPIITTAAEDTDVVVLESFENWSEVVTADGFIGYLPLKRLREVRNEEPVSTFEEPVYTHMALEDKIILAWHQVTLTEANAYASELLGKTKGVNVISPTWFALRGNEGDYVSYAERSYVEKMHGMGIQVWALADNFGHDFSADVDVEEILSRTSVREKLIRNLVNEAESLGIDGINLDFENLPASAGKHYIEFIREMSVSCREKGLILSIDNYVPASYNDFYNIREQGIVADYVILMGYDEHYAGGEAGSVSSIGYVRKALKDALEEIPKERIICGVPFYTRLWTEKGEKVTSETAGIAAAKQWIARHNVNMEWDEECGQYYGSVGSEDSLTELWQEEERSLALKMNAIKEADIAGVAGWKLGMDSEEIWDSLQWD